MEQEAHDEPSKHKSISSPVTRVARVGRHQLLMLRASPAMAWEHNGCHRVLTRGTRLPRGWQGLVSSVGEAGVQGSATGSGMGIALGWGQPALPVLSGMGTRCAGVQHRPCLQVMERGTMQPAAFAAPAPGCHAAPCTARKTLGSTGC